MSAEALHDAHAPALYRYAWSLLGDGGSGGSEDPVAESVYEGLVAGVVSFPSLTDPDDPGPWLYALVRSACQRRGLGRTHPYTGLATVATEEPVARMFSRLPASQRELVELTLRHSLPTSAIARILDLEPGICGELSRTAIRRAAEELHQGSGTTPEPAGGEDPEPNGPLWRAQVEGVTEALSLLCPPGPPPGLRERVLDVCGSPTSEAAAERRRVAALMRPLAADGYPVHRARTDGEAPAEALIAEPAPNVPVSPKALPEDRLTTRDHPAYEGTRSLLPGPDHDPASDLLAERRRWPLPAVSGLAMVVIVLLLWWWAGAMGAPRTLIDAGPDGSPPNSESGEVEALSTASDGRPGGAPDAGTDPERSSTLPPDEPAGTGADPDEPHEEGEDHPEEGTEPAPGRTPGTPPDVPAPNPPPADEDEERPPSNEEPVEEDPEEEPGEETPVNGTGGFLDGLLGLLFGGG
ncbi:RNA polymerase sigma factor [Nocardiopsis alba]|uniref:RNA polymerase sigma factor n=1 Tax=Nocardiopsis alba TaxID=53437 RepID=UPI00365AB9EF